MEKNTLYEDSAKKVVRELQANIGRLRLLIKDNYNNASNMFELLLALTRQNEIEKKIKEVEQEIIAVRLTLPPFAYIENGEVVKIVVTDGTAYSSPDPYEKL